MPESHQRQRPDPGPQCDPADAEIWEQLQRALTKLDQAEERAAVNESRFRSCCRRVEQAERERDEYRRLHRKTATEREKQVERALAAEGQLGQAKRERDEALGQEHFCEAAADIALRPCRQCYGCVGYERQFGSA